MPIDWNDDFEDDLIGDLEQKLGTQFTLAEMFPDEFMQRNTSYSSLNEMLDASPIADITGATAKEKFESPEWSAFVAENSRFGSWEEMLAAGANEETKRRLRN